ncbi:MAG: ethanolamine ammonia lyase-activating protein [Chloroflexi bacterium]|nr:ethanolamine ammonia lyase-activating protein [Chloroflexota bacterium]
MAEAPQAEYDPVLDHGSYRSPYERWKEAEGLPSVHGYFVQNLHDLDLAPWKSRGGSAAFINLEGTGGLKDSYLYELGAGQSSVPVKHIYEETVFILGGRGATEVWIDGKPKQTLEWRGRSLFAIPSNAWHQYHNLSGADSVRFLGITSAPMVMNAFRNRDFVFNNSFVFADRFDGEAGYFRETEKPSGRARWKTNYVADVLARGPLAIREGAEAPATWSFSTGFVTVNQTASFSMVDSTIQAHTSSWPIGTYKPAHRHGPGIHIIILRGHGYSHMWPEGRPVERIDWGPGSLFVPPDNWFHQHFNAGAEPVFFLAIGSENESQRPSGRPYEIFRSVQDGGDRIFYEQEDPAVHRDFEAALAKVGVPCGMGGIHPFCSQR